MQPRRCRSWTPDLRGAIEIEVDGITMRTGRGADMTMIAAIVHALKAAGDRPVRNSPGDGGHHAGRLPQGNGGLATLVREHLKADPFSGAVYVFRAKRADRIKLVFWDGTGLCLFAKRLEEGVFRWPKIEDGVMRLSAGQLTSLRVATPKTTLRLSSTIPPSLRYR